LEGAVESLQIPALQTMLSACYTMRLFGRFRSVDKAHRLSQLCIPKKILDKS